jgi:hypothetical protein
MTCAGLKMIVYDQRVNVTTFTGFFKAASNLLINLLLIKINMIDGDTIRIQKLAQKLSIQSNESCKPSMKGLDPDERKR